MRKLFILILTIIFLLPINIDALSKDYQDVVAPIVNKTIEEEKVNIYLFHSESCPHCKEEIKYLDSIITEKYKDKINIYKYEVSKNKDNSKLLSSIKILFDENSPYVPFTIIGKEYLIGFSETTEGQIEQIIDNYLTDEKIEKSFSIPILGEVKAKDASLSLVAIVLGFIDGFNPCAMWILILLINMTLGIKNRKKMLSIGLTFILTGGIIYFLSMLGIGIIIDLAMITTIRNIIAMFAIILGIYNLYTFIKTRKETGCHVVDKNKRKNIINKINEILSNKSFILSLLGTVVLAMSVNLVELACSLGFPTIFLELLSINNVTGIAKVLYLIIYIFFYLLDDLIIFLIAVFTLKSKGISTKYNKFINLIGGILMIIMGLLLIFKPEWIMFNF